MSVVWVTQEFRPIPTEPVVLANAIFQRALEDTGANRAFSEICRSIASSFTPKLLHALAKAKHDRATDAIAIDPKLFQGIAELIQDWCHNWAGWSTTLSGLAATEALARFYGLDLRKATKQDRIRMLGYLS